MLPNREKYQFDYFTLTNYEKLISIALDKGFEFILHKDDFVKTRKDIIWRHDVEFSTDIALKMAEIENKAGVRTTYFFQLHSDYYNTISKYNSVILRRIKELGHHVGLHFDSHYFNIDSEDDIDKYIEIDKAYFEKIFNIELDTFSFHNTNKFILNCEAYKYGGLINVYARYFKEKYQYCADSTGVWRYEVLGDVLMDDDVKHLQVLIHDANWSEIVLSPKKRIKKSIQDNADRLHQIYDTSNLYIDDLEKKVLQ